MLRSLQRRTTYKVSFFFGGGVEGSLWILSFGVPSRPNHSSRLLKSTLPGPREGSSILNAHLVVVTAAVQAKVAGVLQRPNKHPNPFDEQGPVLDRFWARNLMRMAQKPVPNCPGRRLRQFGTSFWVQVWPKINRKPAQNQNSDLPMSRYIKISIGLPFELDPPVNC